MPLKKIILTHYKNLEHKYGNVEVQRPGDAFLIIQEKLQNLIQFDARRGIQTKIVYLDQDANLGNARVTLPLDESQFKKAVDTAYHYYHPNFMVILGAHDIVPFIQLQHPVYLNRTDHRKYLPSDTPYACEHAYSVQGSDFTSPTRVVSRIPDLFHDGTAGIHILLMSLEAIFRMPTQDAPNYLNPWAVCTNFRIAPMNGILNVMYAGNNHIPIPQQSPPRGPNWNLESYESLTHVHILHGGRQTNILHGEGAGHGNRSVYPEAVNCNFINQNIKDGCVILERACYGGQLYQPQNIALPLVNMYLSSGAACVLGSTVINYSNINGMLAGDHLVSQFYVNLYNRTIGDAFLITKQWLLQNNHTRTPNALAMFLGFTLYGDASTFPMANIQPDFTIPHVPEIGGGYETNTIKLLDNSFYSLEFKESFEIPQTIRKYIESYLAVNYNIEKPTKIFCNEIYEKGKILENRWQYTAYIQKSITENGTFIINDSPIETKELGKTNEPSENYEPDTFEEWYVFEGDREHVTFESNFISS